MSPLPTGAPMPAGYSPRTLSAKLGVQPSSVVVALGEPPNYAELLSPIPAGASISHRLPRSAHFVHQFVTTRAELERALPRLDRALADDGMIWISWPKRASRIATDVTEDVVRSVALPLGLVDVKVCAVDETWSGLKLVRRVSERGRPR